MYKEFSVVFQDFCLKNFTLFQRGNLYFNEKLNETYLQFDLPESPKQEQRNNMGYNPCLVNVMQNKILKHCITTAFDPL